MPAPRRIQRRRSRGWRMPEGAVYVGRPTKWGNPFTLSWCSRLGITDSRREARSICTESFRDWLDGRFDTFGPGETERREWMLTHLAELRGRDLACWCPLDQPCHADVLLEAANR